MQKFNAIHPIVKVSAAKLHVHLLRHLKDSSTSVDEVGVVYEKKTLLQLYNAPTGEPLTFLYVKLRSKKT